MTSSEIEDFRKEAITGHRPTWRMGQNIPEDKVHAGSGVRFGRGARFADPLNIFPEDQAKAADEQAGTPRRQLHRLERKALDSLNLAHTAGKTEIKARFKQLVKRHHPDANGGDKTAEEKLREVIQAYNYLRQAGLA
jgi:hypothetical protein